MKAKILSIYFLLFFVAGIIVNPAAAEDLTIYTYDSFNSEWGPGPIVFKRLNTIGPGPHSLLKES